MENNMEKVFVYGTLKQGKGNHHLLQGSKLLGETVTQDNFTMYHLGGFPGIKGGGNSPVFGEVYEVTGDVFETLDWLEGYPTMYGRKVIPTEFGDAWVYIYNYETEGTHVIEEGVW